ncbi:MAG: hypothetical protein GX780_03265 [Campylobacteraceae bacterium]|nr:hypothetical protein [Campylobacteraceae bacterium]
MEETIINEPDITTDIELESNTSVEHINKRIDFTIKTMRRLETMLPLYSHEAGKCSQSELLSYVVDKAVNKLFESDFKKKLEEL